LLQATAQETARRGAEHAPERPPERRSERAARRGADVAAEPFGFARHRLTSDARPRLKKTTQKRRGIHT
jgi:hypothetical protein